MWRVSLPALSAPGQRVITVEELVGARAGAQVGAAARNRSPTRFRSRATPPRLHVVTAALWVRRLRPAGQPAEEERVRLPLHLRPWTLSRMPLHLLAP